MERATSTAFSGRSSRARRVILAQQLVHQAVGEIVEIVQPLAQIRIGGAQHARAGIRLHALDRGLGGEAGRHRFFQAMHPAAVVGEHPVGLEHVAMLAAVGHFAALEQDVEIRAQGLDRGFQPLELFRHVVGDEIGDHDARLVQHHVSERDAFVERGAGEVSGRRAAGSAPGLASAESSPEAIISASTIAVVCSASSSSSV